MILGQGIADSVRNTTACERSVLAGVINVSMRRAAELTFESTLLGRRAPLPDVAGVVVADKLSAGDFEVSRGDIVACHGDLGIVVACYSEGRELGVIVESMQIARWVAQHSAIVARTGQMRSWPAGQVVLCTAWKKHGDAEFLVVCQ